MNALPGSSAPSAPAPVSRLVTSAGRSTRTQCQKPDGVGASGSKQVTVKLFVPSGASDQLSWGEVLPFAATWSSLIGCPSCTSSLVTVNDGTEGSSSYGSGLTGRSRLIGSPRLWCGGDRPDASAQPFRPSVGGTSPAEDRDNGCMTLDELISAVAA